MSTLRALRVRNLRSLQDTEFIELKAITVLVGRNSAGKSTFARVLPLLRQSTEANKRAPILWFGSYVDFGSIIDARNDKSDEPIEFGFRLLLDDATRAEERENVNAPLELDVFLSVTSEKGDEATRVNEIILVTGGVRGVVSFNSQNEITTIRVGGFTWAPEGAYQQRIEYRYVVPTFRFLREREIVVGNQKRTFLSEHDPLKVVLQDEIRKHLHGNTHFTTVASIAEQLRNGKDLHLDSMRLVSNAPLRWLQSMDGLEKDAYRFTRLRDRVFAARIPQLIDSVNEQLGTFLSGVRYIEPIRATAQRYYRRQELAIDEIDSKGTNVPSFLEGLMPYERADFERWCMDSFGFAVVADGEAGHISLKLRHTADGQPRNLSDLGFGFSQILPIALQLWSLGRIPQYRLRFRQRVTTTVVIEQPELHLHPAYQARLADVFATAVRPSLTRRKPALLVETHSSSIINRLGQLIAEDKLNPEDVQVILFEKDAEDSPTRVRAVAFDDDGVLKDWPFGFFEP